MWQKFLSDKRYLGLGVVLLVIAALPVTLGLIQQEQDIRQRAATTPQVCTADQATDAMMIIDRSGSMNNATSATDATPRITSAKAAANAFIDILQKRTAQPLHAVDITTISSDGQSNVVLSLTRDMTKAHAAIDAIAVGGGTCIECAIRNAMADFGPNERSGVKNIAVILTDGGATQVIGAKADGSAANQKIAAAAAFKAAMEAHTKYNMAFYTIGFGESVNDQFLINVATSSGGMYYFAPDGASLTKIYQNIAQIIGQGAVSGTVFNDVNGDGQRGTTEPVLAGWKVTVINKATGNTVGTVTTDASGSYTFQGLCDGSYTVKVDTQAGWNQTLPSNGESRTETVSKGNVITGQDFGFNLAPKATSLVCSPDTISLGTAPQTITATFKDSSGNPIPNETIAYSAAPTAAFVHSDVASTKTNQNGMAQFNINVTSTTLSYSGKITLTHASTANYAAASCDIDASFEPASTILNFNVLLHGLGNAGDNANPVNSSLSNKNPGHITRPITIQIYDIDNKLITTSTWDTDYNQAKGSWPVSREVGSGFPTGKYNIFVSSPGYLSNRFSQTLSITTQQVNTLPDIQLVTGDIDESNKLNILDYDLLVGCYSDFAPPIACNQQNKTGTDINDDSKIDQNDLNLLLREFSVQYGATIDQSNN